MPKRIFVCLLILALLASGCTAQTRPSGESESGSPTLPPSAPVVTGRADTDEDLPSTNTPTEASATEPRMTEPTETEPAETEPPVSMVENTAFTGIAGSDCDASILGVLCNAPFVNGEPVQTEVWCEGEYDQLVICPRWVGSEVAAWQIVRWQDEEGENERLEGPVYTAVCEEGTCIGAALDRPEGGAAWAVSVTAPDGSNANYELYYNGRYGTLACEYLTDNAAGLNGEAERMDPTLVDEMTGQVGDDVFYSLLRAAARIRKDPWAVLERYCSPLCDFGDSAAYTVCQGEMEGDTYYLEAARLRENYDDASGSIAERTAHQAALYDEIGNEGGILGIDPTASEALYFDLNGLTVYNPTLLAQEVTITVNGIETGTYELTEGDFITLLDVCCGELPTDEPIRIELRVTESRGDPAAAILEVWPGVGGNISGAR